jgi:hypothetical protein
MRRCNIGTTGNERAAHAMNICNRCGNDNAPSHQFCVLCGAALVRRSVEPEIQQPISDSAEPRDGRTPALGGWTLEHLIASGGSGRVYRVHDARGRAAAMKLYHEPANLTDLASIKSLSAVRHENLAAILDHGVDDGGQRWVVMELIEGASLAQHLARSGPLSPHDVQRLGVAIAHGLGALHAKGLVHRDIKPANILLPVPGDFDRARLVDFGYAGRRSSESHTTMAGALIGSPAYMSPEQVSARGLDHRSDLWSLGVVLFEAATGTLPFGGSNVGAVLMGILNQPLSLDSVPRPLRAAIGASLNRAPEDRPQSASDFARLLTSERVHVGENAPLSIQPSRASEGAETEAAESSSPEGWGPLVFLAASFVVVLAVMVLGPFLLRSVPGGAALARWWMLALSLLAGVLVWVAYRRLRARRESPRAKRAAARAKRKGCITESVSVAVDELAQHYRRHPHAKLITESMALVLEDYRAIDAGDPEKKLELTLKVLETVMRLESRIGELTSPWYRRYERTLAAVSALGTASATWWALGQSVTDVRVTTLIRGCPNTPIEASARVRLDSAESATLEWSLEGAPAIVSSSYRWPEDSGRDPLTAGTYVVWGRRGTQRESCVIAVSASEP